MVCLLEAAVQFAYNIVFLQYTMMMISQFYVKFMKRIIKLLAVASAVILARLLPFNLIVGSSFAMFSWSTMFAPVVAAQYGLGWVISFICSKFFITNSLCTVTPLFLLHRLPLLIASYAFVKRTVLTSLFVPGVCMALFMTHSVGSEAWLYAMYWLIPIGLYIVQDSDWSRAVTASFVAHAVGSVVYLYAGEISADVWMALIPVVACERLFMSGAIVFLNRLCSTCGRLIKIAYKRISYYKAV